jgi:hypothetical protein
VPEASPGESYAVCMHPGALVAAGVARARSGGEWLPALVRTCGGVELCVATAALMLQPTCHCSGADVGARTGMRTQQHGGTWQWHCAARGMERPGAVYDAA